MSDWKERSTEKMNSCQLHIQESVERLKSALDRYPEVIEEGDDAREEVDAEICLTSRSAYFDFYTWIVLNDRLEEEAVKTLANLFERALDVMKKGGKFRASVQERFDEFNSKCGRLRQGKGSWIASSMQQA